MLSDLRIDTRHSVRSLCKNPGYALTVLLTLTLAIGANLSIFSLANALIFASLPVPAPDRLMEITTVDAKGDKGNLSIPAFQAIEQHTGAVFENLLAWTGGGVENVEMNGIPSTGSVDEVGGDYYGTLGIRPAIGRLINAADVSLDHFKSSAVAVISYRAWRDRYHCDPGVIGKTVRINGRPYTIIGVHPESFVGLIREVDADATIPVTAYASNAARLYDRKNAFYSIIGRLRAGVSESQARSRIAAIWPGIRQSTAPDSEPEHRLFIQRRIQVEPAASGFSYLRQRFTRPLYILFAIVGLLLLLACVNLANVALARAHSRSAEFSVRAALGAGRWRLLRASMLESMILSILGALPGLFLAYWGSRRLAQFAWGGLVPLALTVVPDSRVVLFTAAITIAAGLLFGLIPAWRASGAHLHGFAGMRVVSNLGLTGRALVAIQIALSFVILTGAALLTRSLQNVLHQDKHFAADRLLVAQLFPLSNYRGFDNAAYFRQLLESLRSIPGASSAAIAHSHLVGQVAWKETISPANVQATYHLVSPGFFEAVGIRIVRGRDFDLRDDESHPPVMIASQRLARLIAPNSDAIGTRVRIGDFKGEFEVVGIVSDALLDDPRQPDVPAVFVSNFQRPDFLRWSAAIVRTTGDPTQLARALRSHIESLGREFPLTIETVSDELGRAMLPERILTLLTNLFGALAVLLAAVGLFGLLSYTVGCRTAEIGIRGALGASRSQIGTLILKEVGVLLVIGLVAGIAISIASSRLLGVYLYGLSKYDPPSLLIAVGILAIVASAASFLPALRAARIDPASALRYE